MRSRFTTARCYIFICLIRCGAVVMTDRHTCHQDSCHCYVLVRCGFAVAMHDSSMRRQNQHAMVPIRVWLSKALGGLWTRLLSFCPSPPWSGQDLVIPLLRLNHRRPSTFGPLRSMIVPLPNSSRVHLTVMPPGCSLVRGPRKSSVGGRGAEVYPLWPCSGELSHGHARSRESGFPPGSVRC